MVKKKLFSFSLALLLSSNGAILAENEIETTTLQEEISCGCVDKECVDCECTECSEADDASSRCPCKKKNKIKRTKRDWQHMLECAECVAVRLTVERDENNPRWESFAMNACGLMRGLAFADKEEALQAVKNMYEMAIAAGLETDITVSTEPIESEPTEKQETEEEILDPETIVRSKRIVVTCSVDNPGQMSPVWRSITEKVVEAVASEDEQSDEVQVEDALALGQEIIELVSESEEDVHGKITIVAEADKADETIQETDEQ